jgi:ribonuclease Z
MRAMTSAVFASILVATTTIPLVRAPAQASRTAPRRAAPAETAIILLGTGGPPPNPDAFGPATAVTVGHRVFIIDAGAGITRRMRSAGLPMTGITALFVTHLHSDHTLGYPDLMLTSWVMGRTRPFAVFGPPGIRDMTDHILAAWSEDIDIRVHGLEHRPPSYGVDVHEVQPGVVYDEGGVRVTAFPVQHGNWKYSYGYRFDTPDRSIVISGDTRPSESLVAAARGCDVLVHEAHHAGVAPPPNAPGGASWQEYMHEFHTSDVELGAIAARVQPKLLILTHVGRVGATDADLIAGVRKGGFTGRVAVGRDLDRY